MPRTLDLLPLLAFALGVAVDVTLLVFLRQRDPVGTPGDTPARARAPRTPLVATVAVLVALGPYVAFWAVSNGDPDVWDFYRTASFVPLVVLGVLGAVVTLIASRSSRSSRLPRDAS